MPRATFHNETHVVICHGCQSEQVEPAGPVRCIKWRDKAEAQCRTCKKRWLSENKVLLSRARERFGEAA